MGPIFLSLKIIRPIDEPLWISRLWNFFFQEFVLNLSTLSRGTVDEKLNWTFQLYDVNRDGFITKNEMQGKKNFSPFSTNFRWFCETRDSLYAVTFFIEKFSNFPKQLFLASFHSIQIKWWKKWMKEISFSRLSGKLKSVKIN